MASVRLAGARLAPRRAGIAAMPLFLAAVSLAAAPAAITPEAAIARAVSARLGERAVVAVSAIHTAVGAEAGLEAVPEPNARLAQPARFVMVSNGVRRGVAVATVKVVASYPRASRAIHRDEAIGGDAVDFTTGDVPPMALRPLLTAKEMVGVTARREIAAGEPLSAAVLRVPPLVKSGDSVDVTIRIGVVTVTGPAIASGSGQHGDIIRVMQTHTTKLLKARITGPGAVEIIE
jgi:flagella basal body P-ring formation protein FlgA